MEQLPLVSDPRFLKFREDYTTNEHLLTLHDDLQHLGKSTTAVAHLVRSDIARSEINAARLRSASDEQLLSIQGELVDLRQTASNDTAVLIDRVEFLSNGQRDLTQVTRSGFVDLRGAVELGFSGMATQVGEQNQVLKEGFSSLSDTFHWGLAQLAHQSELQRALYEKTYQALLNPSLTKATEHRKRAEKAMVNKWWDDADREFKIAIQENPFDYLAHFHIGYLSFFNKHSWNDATDSYSRAAMYADTVDADQSQKYYAALAYIHLQMLWRLEAKTSDTSPNDALIRAFEASSRAVELCPDELFVRVEHAVNCTNNGRLEEAVSLAVLDRFRDHERLAAYLLNPDVKRLPCLYDRLVELQRSIAELLRDQSLHLPHFLNLALKSEHSDDRIAALTVVRNLREFPAIDSLGGLLSDSSKSVRIAALSVLTQHYEPAFRSLFLSALLDQSVRVRQAALEQVRHVGATLIEYLVDEWVNSHNCDDHPTQNLEPMLYKLGLPVAKRLIEWKAEWDNDPVERYIPNNEHPDYKATHKLLLSIVTAHPAAVMGALRSNSRSIREQGVQLIDALSNDLRCGPLNIALRDTDSDIRQCAVYYLGEHPDGVDLRVVLSIISTDDEVAKYSALEYVSTIVDERVTDVLLDVLTRDYWYEWELVADILGRRQEQRAIEPFLKIMSGEIDEKSSWRVIDPLAQIGIATIPLLECILRGSNNSAKSCAVQVLSKLHTDEAVPGLLIAVAQDSEYTRQYAALALGSYSKPEVVKALGRLLSDQCPDVARAAKKALIDIGQLAVEEFRLALRSKASLARRLAAEGLCEINPQVAAREIRMRLLLGIFGGEWDYDVRDRMKRLLNRINRK